MSMDGQGEVIDYLSRPSSYPGDVANVEIIETHASLVFLAGSFAYKLKRSIRYPYLDYSTATLRKRACEAELTLNRRTAPSLYLAVRSVDRRADGSLGFGGGEPQDWLVVMRRFEQSALLDSLAAAGKVTPELMLRLTDHIAAFHDEAEPRPDHGGRLGTLEVIELNGRSFEQAAASGLDRGAIAALHDRSLAALAAQSELLEKRRLQQRVRRCHGDLHLRNVCLLDGEPVLFDCIEFSEAIACIDVLYDLAFLLMDLGHRGMPNLASLVLNRYLDLSGDDDGLAALPLFLSLRAAIRAHVTAIRLQRGAVPDPAAVLNEARRYLDLARLYLEPTRPHLVAIGGLSGSGKSTAARALAPELGVLPGARVLRSDVIRKRLLGFPPETRLPPDGYANEVTDRVYASLCDKAVQVLAGGYSVIIDAVSARPGERDAFAAVAKRAGVPFQGIWLEAPPATMERRLKARRGDASDATPEVLRGQLAHDLGPMNWVRINASGDTADCVAAIRCALAAPQR